MNEHEEAAFRRKVIAWTWIKLILGAAFQIWLYWTIGSWIWRFFQNLFFH